MSFPALNLSRMAVAFRVSLNCSVWYEKQEQQTFTEHVLGALHCVKFFMHINQLLLMRIL